MDDIWVVFSFQNRERSSRNQDSKGKWKWSVQLKEAHNSGWSVLASEHRAQQGFGKVVEGCLTLSGQIRFPSIFTPWRTKGRSPELRYIFVRSAVIYLWYSSLLDCSGPHIYDPFLFSPTVEQAAGEINSYSPNWIRISKLLGFHFSIFVFLFFFFLNVISLFAWYIIIKLS